MAEAPRRVLCSAAIVATLLTVACTRTVIRVVPATTTTTPAAAVTTTTVSQAAALEQEACVTLQQLFTGQRAPNLSALGLDVPNAARLDAAYLPLQIAYYQMTSAAPGVVVPGIPPPQVSRSASQSAVVAACAAATDIDIRVAAPVTIAPVTIAPVTTLAPYVPGVNSDRGPTTSADCIPCRN